MVGDDGKNIEIRPGLLQPLAVGTWNHLAVTYDGSGERAGLNLYLNGRVVPTQGSDYFARLEGNIRTSQPILLGKQVRKDNEEYLAGARSNRRGWSRFGRHWNGLGRRNPPS